MKKKRKIIFFDFDGVIADSFEMAFGVNKMVTKETRMKKDDYRSLFDGNINDWKKTSSLSKQEKDRIDKEFFEIYDPLMKKIKIIPGIKNVLKKFSKDYLLIIISSTISSPIREFMDRYGLSSFFDVIMGNDVHNSKSKKISIVFNKYNVRCDDCIFITDTLGDIKEATRKGVQSIGVTWGFQKRKNLLKGKPFSIAKKPEDLLNIVSRYFEQN